MLRRVVLAAAAFMVASSPGATVSAGLEQRAQVPVAPEESVLGIETPEPIRELRTQKKVPLKKDRITVAIARMAASFLDRPMLSETIRTVDGVKYSFCVEPHYHAPGSGKFPEGWHTGVTVYAFEDE